MKRETGPKLLRYGWLVLLGGLLFWALRSVPLQDVWSALSQLRLWQVGALLALDALVFGLMTARWWIIVRADDAAAAYLPLYGYRLAAFAMSYFTFGPQVGGEPLQVLFLQRKFRLTFARATSAVILDKLLELLGNVIFLAIGLAAIFQSGILPVSATQVTGGLIPMAAILAWPPIHIFLLYRGKYPLSVLARAAQSRFGNHSFLRLIVVSERMAGSFTRRRFGALMASLGVSLASQAGMVIGYWLLAGYIGYPLAGTQALAGMTALQVAFMVPVPAGMGAAEASQVFIFAAMGYSAAAGLTMSLLLRMRDILFGGIGLFIAGKI